MRRLKMASIDDIKRMCKWYDYTCDDCPLSMENCLPNSLPGNVNEIVDKWVAEHPIKTYAMDFFEKFPDAPRTTKGNPCPCIGSIYSEFNDKNCLLGGCSECWNLEMKKDN